MTRDAERGPGHRAGRSRSPRSLGRRRRPDCGPGRRSHVEHHPLVPVDRAADDAPGRRLDDRADPRGNRSPRRTHSTRRRRHASQLDEVVVAPACMALQDIDGTDDAHVGRSSVSDPLIDQSGRLLRGLDAVERRPLAPGSHRRFGDELAGVIEQVCGAGAPPPDQIPPSAKDGVVGDRRGDEGERVDARPVGRVSTESSTSASAVARSIPKG